MYIQDQLFNLLNFLPLVVMLTNSKVNSKHSYYCYKVYKRSKDISQLCLSLLVFIPIALIHLSLILMYIRYLQEKETAKSMLQGLKRAQTGFPSMDIDQFGL
jgi:hypothetical protein